MTFRPLRGIPAPRADGAAQDTHMGDDEREAGALAERVRNFERRLDALEAALGKIQSDMVNVRTASVADHGRQTIIVILIVVWPVIVSGIALIVELSTR